MNAFAVPGGYVYVTRQLLGLMNSEAELALVLGHETGHITADHSAERQNRSIFTQLGAALLGVVTGSGELAQLAAQGAQIWNLSYSRGQELEADDLGIRYMTAAGYDPAAAPVMLDALGAWSEMEARFAGREDDARSVPSWARTHPLSADRSARAAERAQATGQSGQGTVNRDQHLNAINGMIFDDDPAQGVIEGQAFLHPDLRLAFTVPPGFGMQNGARSVSIVGSSGQALFSTGPYSGNLDTYIGQVFRGLTGDQGQIQYSQSRPTTINGLKAAISTARAQTQQGVLDINVVAYEFAPDRAYHFVTVTPAGSGIGPVRVDGPVAAAAVNAGSGGDPAARHPDRHGWRRRHRPDPRQPDGLWQLSARALPHSQRPGRGRYAAARPADQVDRLWSALSEQ
jgi:predicted Zn-dependent protease